MSRPNLLQINRFRSSAIFCSSQFFLFQSFFILFLHHILGSTIGDTVGGSAGEIVVDAKKILLQINRFSTSGIFCSSQSFFYLYNFYNVSPSGSWKHCWWFCGGGSDGCREGSCCRSTGSAP
jgi:hypothetical protein